MTQTTERVLHFAECIIARRYGVKQSAKPVLRPANGIAGSSQAVMHNAEWMAHGSKAK